MPPRKGDWVKLGKPKHFHGKLVRGATHRQTVPITSLAQERLLRGRGLPFTSYKYKGKRRYAKRVNA